MYTLLFFRPEDDSPTATYYIPRAEDLFAKIPGLFAEEPACECIVVMFNEVRLFSTDRDGNMSP